MSTPITTLGPTSGTIPSFNHSGVLPPYVGADPTIVAGMAPYVATIDEMVARFNTSPSRATLLQGLLRYRRDLISVGLYGWQWLDGSFMEDVETLQSRSPSDIDVVTFVAPPASVTSAAQGQAFAVANAHLLNNTQTKPLYGCDAYIVNLGLGPYSVVSQARYWFGLFSHQRVSAVWKGMVEVALPVGDADAAARAVLGVV
jgi:hypothetical protein